jgi:hypothetical protein
VDSSTDVASDPTQIETVTGLSSTGLKADAIGYVSNLGHARVWSADRLGQRLGDLAVVWIALMTWICLRGIELSARVLEEDAAYRTTSRAAGPSPR